MNPQPTLGARALALVGTASVLAVGVIELTDGCTTLTTIHNNTV